MSSSSVNDPAPGEVVALLSKPTADAEPFWSACDRGELQLPKCRTCGRFSYFPRLHCPHCGSREVHFETASRSGRVHSFAHVRFSPFGNFWQEDVPYTVLRVDMDCGVRLLSRLVGRDRTAVRIGERVQAHFAAVKGSERRIPVFVRCADPSSETQS